MKGRGLQWKTRGILPELARRRCGMPAQPCGPAGRIADARVKRARSVRRHTGGKQRMRCGESRTADKESVCGQGFAGICLLQCGHAGT